MFRSVLDSLRDRLGERWGRHVGRAATLPPYLSDDDALDGPPPKGGAAETLLWTANRGSGPLPATGALALAGLALYRLGLQLAEDDVAARGLAALLGEAKRSLNPSGMWVEQSTVRHLQMTGAYAEAWLLARRYGRGEKKPIEAVLRPMLAVLPALCLPGGMPLIGGLPDPTAAATLAGLLPGGGEAGWVGTLPADERAALLALRDGERLHDLERLRPEGWLRFDIGRWAGLWHVHPEGRSAKDGLTHHDFGSFEIHFGHEPIFIDPGAPPIGSPEAEAERARSASFHSNLTLGGQGTYAAAGDGAPPRLRAEYDGVSLSHDGFATLGGPKMAERRWVFDGPTMTIADAIQGTGRHRIERHLVTPAAVAVDGETAILHFGDGRLVLQADAVCLATSTTGWTAGGQARPLTVINFAVETNLPWRGLLNLSFETA
jgi:hypothetical protein